MASQGDALITQAEILEAIQKLWTLKDLPSSSMSPAQELDDSTKTIQQALDLLKEPSSTKTLYEGGGGGGGGLSSCWDFMDIIPPQTGCLRSRSSSFGSGGTVATNPSPSDEDALASSSTSSSISPATVQIQAWSAKEEGNFKKALIDMLQKAENKIIMMTTTTNLVDPANFRVYSIQGSHSVGWEAIFFVEEKQNRLQGSEPVSEIRNYLKIEVARPDASTEEIALRKDPSSSYHSGRYFCSFSPKETGYHFLSIFVSDGSGPDRRHIQGSPVVVTAIRNYPNSNGCNFVRMGFNPAEPFCGKAWGIAVYRPDNLIYLADRDFHQIVILNESSHIIRKFGTEGSQPGQLYRPTGVAVDSVFKRVIISDKDNHRIAVFDLSGKFLFNFGNKGHLNGEFNYPWGIAVSPNGRFIAVADSRNHRIQMFDKTGKFLAKFSVFESRPFEFKEEFDYPRGITFSLDGSQVFATDFNLNAVFVFNVGLTRPKTLILPGILSRPQGLTVDEAGNVLLVDSKNHLIHVMSPTGNHIYTMRGSGKDRFQSPMDVAVLRGGRVAVVDKENRLRIF